MTKRIDCTGLSCPLPVVETRKALKDLKSGQSLEVVVDTGTSKENVTRLAKSEGFEVSAPVQDGDQFIITITKP